MSFWIHAYCNESVGGLPVTARNDLAQPVVHADELPGFTLDGERWTYKALLQDILDKNKVACKRRIFAGEGHPIDQTQRTEVYELIRQWLSDQQVLGR